VVSELPYGDSFSNWSDWSAFDGQTDFLIVFESPPENRHDGSLIYLLTRRLRL
jgi:hypothetical protein